MAEAKGKIKVAAGSKFEDISFPADSSSIHWTRTYSLKWKRPTEIEKSPSLWGSKGIRPAAINQGGLGDCWLLASMAAIGEWPDRIEKIFNGIKTYPTNGQFVTKFWLYGKEQRVTIDDRIPGREYYKRFYNSYTRKSSNGAWWGPILEKASAKYYGNYYNMSGGWMSESIQALTGVPTVTIYHKKYNADTLWKQIGEWEKKQYIMTGAVMGRGDK